MKKEIVAFSCMLLASCPSYGGRGSTQPAPAPVAPTPVAPGPDQNPLTPSVPTAPNQPTEPTTTTGGGTIPAQKPGAVPPSSPPVYQAPEPGKTPDIPGSPNPSTPTNPPLPPTKPTLPQQPIPMPPPPLPPIGLPPMPGPNKPGEKGNSGGIAIPDVDINLKTPEAINKAVKNAKDTADDVSNFLSSPGNAAGVTAAAIGGSLALGAGLIATGVGINKVRKAINNRKEETTARKENAERETKAMVKGSGVEQTTAPESTSRTEPLAVSATKVADILKQPPPQLTVPDSAKNYEFVSPTSSSNSYDHTGFRDYYTEMEKNLPLDTDHENKLASLKQERDESIEKHVKNKINKIDIAQITGKEKELAQLKGIHEVIAQRKLHLHQEDKDMEKLTKTKASLLTTINATDKNNPALSKKLEVVGKMIENLRESQNSHNKVIKAHLVTAQGLIEMHKLQEAHSKLLEIHANREKLASMKH